MAAAIGAALLTVAVLPVSSAEAATPAGHEITRTLTGLAGDVQFGEPTLLVDDVNHHLITGSRTTADSESPYVIRLADLRTSEVIATYTTEAIWGYLHIAIDPALDNVYVSSLDGVTVLNLKNLQFKGVIGQGPIEGLAVNRATHRLYAGTPTELSVFDGSDGTTLATIDGLGDEGGVQSIAVDESLNKIYIAGYDPYSSTGDGSGLMMVDGIENAVQRTFRDSDLQGVETAWDIAVDPGSSDVYVAGIYGGMSVIHPDGTVAAVANAAGPDQSQIAVSDGVAYVANSGGGGIAVVDADSDTVTTTLLPDNYAAALALDASSGALYVPEEMDSTQAMASTRILEISPTTTAQTGTDLTVTEADSGSGATLTYTATLEPSASGGTVAFTQDGLDVPDCDAVPVQAGSATCDAGTAVAGPHTVTAVYTGSPDFGMSSASVTFSIAVGSGSTSGSGTSGGSGGSTDQTPGSVTSSDPEGTVPTSTNRLVVSVESPVTGQVTITKQDESTFLPGYTAIGASSVIVAPQASETAPLRLTFKAYIADMPAEFFPADVAVFRNGVSVPSCEGSAVAVPDPCVTDESVSGGIQTFTVLTSRASTWDLEAANVTRSSGADRYATAIAVSQTGFLDHSASAVVLATGDQYPDALVGTPLAAAKGGPLLLTHGGSLPLATQTEIQRVLKPGGTVYVLGGTAVVPQAVAASLEGLGYKVVRYSGQDRYATAVKVAEALGSPSTVLLATGQDFADALAAGTGAAKAKGAVLLTDGDSLPDATAAYLKSFRGTLQAVGGPAASAAPTAKPLVGADRYQTSVVVAQALFPSPTGMGVATGTTFPDALAGGALLGKLGQPLLLAGPSGLSPKVTEYLTGVKGTAKTARLFGGTGVLSASVQSAVASALGQG
jgi:hypothetical protein